MRFVFPHDIVSEMLSCQRDFNCKIMNTAQLYLSIWCWKRQSFSDWI